MKGNVTEVWRVYDGQNKKLVIPVYQRNYDWSQVQCERLFDDLESIVREGRKAHFFGALVGVNEDSFTWVVIDGQQRLTTVSLLILALAHAAKTGDIELRDPALPSNLVSSYLEIGFGEEARIKLKPVKNDSAAYERLFGPPEQFLESSSVTANYRYFRDRLRSTSLTADEVWTAVQRLQVMLLDLESEDEPQRIFETLNSTGLALKESDKIRNFVLMGQPTKEQDRLYEHFWNPMERAVDYRTDWFVRWYLVTVTGKTPNEAEVYEAFKAHLARQKSAVADVLADMYDYATLVQQMTMAGTGDAAVDKVLARFRTFRSDVLLPFILPVLRDFRSKIITTADMVRVLEILESYLLRRQITGYYANALNKIFAIAYKELRHLRTTEQPYADLLIYNLRKRDGTTGQFPTDAEFVEALHTRNVYRMPAETRTYLFDRLENGQSADNRDIVGKVREGDLSIEHIMPQQLSRPWRDALGQDAERVHEEWLHRLGNLTVTGYNSSYSNSSFEQKMHAENGLADSPYRLNADVRNQLVWGEAQMRERTRRLAEQAKAIWPYVSTDFAPPTPVLPVEPMGEDTDFRSRNIAAFEFGDTTRTVASWKEMQVAVLQLVARDHRGQLLEIAEKHTYIKLLLASEEPTPGYERVDSALAVYTATDTRTKMNVLRGVFERIGIDPDSLMFTLRGAAVAEDEDTPTGRADAADRDPAPYEIVTKFLPRVEELVGQNIEPDDTANLREEFRTSFAPLAPADPKQGLGGTPYPAFKKPETIAAASADALLSAIAMTLALEQDYDPDVLHEAMRGGLLASWLRRLGSLGA